MEYENIIHGPRKRKISSSVFSAFLSGMLGGSSIFVFLALIFPQAQDLFQESRFAIVDTTAIIHDRAQSLANQKISQRHIHKDQEVFIRELNAVLHQLSKEKNVTLLKPEATLSPLPNYTDEVIDRLHMMEIIAWKNKVIEARESED